jgi:proteasome lid subunit RPN8/RPN11
VTHDGLVTAGSYLHRGEAEIARAHLDAEGVPSVVIPDDEGGLNPGFYDEYRVRLAVRARDRVSAAAILGGNGLPIPLPRQIRDAIVGHASFCAPLEACGLLAFDPGAALRMAYCLTNADRSRTRFTVDPNEHFQAIRHAERNGWVIAGVFHSHPVSAAQPSAADIAGATVSGWLHVVAGPLSDPQVRGFAIDGDGAIEVPLQVT